MVKDEGFEFPGLEQVRDETPYLYHGKGFIMKDPTRGPVRPHPLDLSAPCPPLTIFLVNASIRLVLIKVMKGVNILGHAGGKDGLVGMVDRSLGEGGDVCPIHNHASGRCALCTFQVTSSTSRLLDFLV